MKKYITLLTVTVLLLSVLSGCGCKHEWVSATCDAPKTCTLCGKTDGEALGHNFSHATCSAPSTCSRCGLTQGGMPAHNLTEATCTAPSTCTVCGQTVGDPLPHSFSEATCEAPSTCTVCGLTQGEPLSHTPTDANFQEAGVCSVCGQTVGEPLTAGFVELGIEPKLAEAGAATPITIDGTQYSYTVVYDDILPGDDSHEAKEGYHWRSVKIRLEALENQENLGTEQVYYSNFTDYYDPEGQTGSILYRESSALLQLSFTSNYLGKDYTECLMQLDYSSLDYNGVNEWVLEEVLSFRIPEGYDGILLCMGEAEKIAADYVSMWKDFYADENTLFYRLK